ncbi:hypothetical protein ACWGJX_43290 [Streptomyces sp. NPDC054775]
MSAVRSATLAGSGRLDMRPLEADAHRYRSDSWQNAAFEALEGSAHGPTAVPDSVVITSARSGLEIGLNFNPRAEYSSFEERRVYFVRQRPGSIDHEWRKQRSPWTELPDRPYFVIARVASDGIFVENGPSVSRIISPEQFGYLLNSDRRLQEFPSDAPLVLVLQNSGVEGVDKIARVVAAQTSRIVYAPKHSAVILPSPKRDSFRITSHEIMASSTKSRREAGWTAHYPGDLHEQVVAEGSPVGHRGLPMVRTIGGDHVSFANLRLNPVTNLEGRFLGHSSFKPEERSTEAQKLRHIAEQFTYTRAEAVDRELYVRNEDAIPVPWAFESEQPVFFAAHGWEQGVQLQHVSGASVHVDGTQLGKVLGYLTNQRPAGASIVLLACSAGGAPDEGANVGQRVADETGRVVHAPSGWVAHTLSVAPGHGGIEAEWRTMIPAAWTTPHLFTGGPARSPMARHLLTPAGDGRVSDSGSPGAWSEGGHSGAHHSSDGSNGARPSTHSPLGDAPRGRARNFIQLPPEMSPRLADSPRPGSLRMSSAISRRQLPLSRTSQSRAVVAAAARDVTWARRRPPVDTRTVFVAYAASAGSGIRRITPRAAPWASFGEDPHVVLANAPAGRIFMVDDVGNRPAMTPGQFAGHIKEALVLQRVRSGAPLVLVMAAVRDYDDLLVPRLLATVTGRTVFYPTGRVRLLESPDGATSRLSLFAFDDMSLPSGSWVRIHPGDPGSDIGAAAGQNRDGHVTSLDGRVISDREIATRVMVDAQHRPLGFDSIDRAEWVMDEAWNGPLHMSALRTFRQGRRDGEEIIPVPGTERELPWHEQGQNAPYFVRAHGWEDQIELHHIDGAPVKVDGEQFGRFLTRRRSFDQMRSDRPVVLVSCSTGARGRPDVLAQVVANVTGRRVYAPSADSSVVLDIVPDTDGTAGEWRDFLPQSGFDKSHENSVPAAPPLHRRHPLPAVLPVGAAQRTARASGMSPLPAGAGTPHNTGLASKRVAETAAGRSEVRVAAGSRPMSRPMGSGGSARPAVPGRSAPRRLDRKGLEESVRLVAAHVGKRPKVTRNYERSIAAEASWRLSLVEGLRRELYPGSAPSPESLHDMAAAGAGAKWRQASDWSELTRAVRHLGPGSSAFILANGQAVRGHAFALVYPQSKRANGDNGPVWAELTAPSKEWFTVGTPRVPASNARYALIDSVGRSVLIQPPTTPLHVSEADRRGRLNGSADVGAAEKVLRPIAHRVKADRPPNGTVVAHNEATGVTIRIDDAVFLEGRNKGLYIGDEIDSSQVSSRRMADILELSVSPLAGRESDRMPGYPEDSAMALYEARTLLSDADHHSVPSALADLLPERLGWKISAAGQDIRVSPYPKYVYARPSSVQFTVGLSVENLHSFLQSSIEVVAAQKGMGVHFFLGARIMADRIAAQYAADVLGRHVRAKDVPYVTHVRGVQEVRGYMWHVAAHVSALSAAMKFGLTTTKVLPVAGLNSFGAVRAQLSPPVQKFLRDGRQRIRSEVVSWVSEILGDYQRTSKIPSLVNETGEYIAPNVRTSDFLEYALAGRTGSGATISQKSLTGIADAEIDRSVLPPHITLKVLNFSWQGSELLTPAQSFKSFAFFRHRLQSDIRDSQIRAGLTQDPTSNIWLLEHPLIGETDQVLDTVHKFRYSENEMGGAPTQLLLTLREGQNLRDRVSRALLTGSIDPSIREDLETYRVTAWRRGMDWEFRRDADYYSRVMEATDSFLGGGALAAASPADVGAKIRLPLLEWEFGDVQSPSSVKWQEVANPLDVPRNVGLYVPGNQHLRLNPAWIRLADVEPKFITGNTLVRWDYAVKSDGDIILGTEKASQTLKGEHFKDLLEGMRKFDPSLDEKRLATILDGLGHPSIAAKFDQNGRAVFGDARVAGEFGWSESLQCWEVSDESGRYMVNRGYIRPEDRLRWLTNVAGLFSRRLGIMVRVVPHGEV